jgi:hypothetical protein
MIVVNLINETEGDDPDPGERCPEVVLDTERILQPEDGQVLDGDCGIAEEKNLQ